MLVREQDSRFPVARERDFRIRAGRVCAGMKVSHLSRGSEISGWVPLLCGASDAFTQLIRNVTQSFVVGFVGGCCCSIGELLVSEKKTFSSGIFLVSFCAGPVCAAYYHLWGACLYRNGIYTLPWPASGIICWRRVWAGTGSHIYHGITGLSRISLKTARKLPRDTMELLVLRVPKYDAISKPNNACHSMAPAMVLQFKRCSQVERRGTCNVRTTGRTRDSHRSFQFLRGCKPVFFSSTTV